jgi:outer membrane protein assembly factor BamD
MSPVRVRRATVYALAGLACLLGAGCAATKPNKRVREDPRAAYVWAVERIDQGKCLQASETLRLLSLEQTGVPYVDSIFYHLARAYACMGDHALAQVEYERVVNQYPSSALVDDAAFGLAHAQFMQAPKNPGLDQQEAEKAVASLEDFLAIYPLSDRRSEANALLQEMKNRLAKKAFDSGRLYLKLQADSSAMIYFQQLWDDFTQSPYAARALWLLAEKERKRENWEGAIQRYEQLISVYPDAVEVPQSKLVLERMKTDQAKRLHEEAHRAHDRGDLDLAASRYEALLAQFPNYVKTPEVKQDLEKVRSELAGK